MSAEQQHGKIFERLVIDDSGLFPEAKGIEIGHIEEMDVPAHITPDGIPVSIKSAKSDPTTGGQVTLALSDATRFFRNVTSGPMRLIAGFYMPLPEHGRISIYQIHEFLLDPSLKTLLWGDLEEEDLQDFSTKIAMWAKEDSDKGLTKRTGAQNRARRHKALLQPRAGLVTLNQKISSTNHRLQCSISATHLRCACIDKGLPVRVFSSEDPQRAQYGALQLPIPIDAGGRSSRLRF